MSKRNDLHGVRQMRWGEVRVPLSHVEIGVAEDFLQVIDIAPSHHEVGSKRVAEIVKTDGRLEARARLRELKIPVEMQGIYGLSFSVRKNELTLLSKISGRTHGRPY